MRVLASKHQQALLLHIFVLAAVYALAGRLALLLAIPPGYSMAVYPPAGIALGILLTKGYRLLPGVALGAFAVNLFISFENSGQLSASALILSAMLAVGASLQAGLSACLIMRLLGADLPLDNHSIIFRFFLYGGLLGCLISASVGVLSLYVLGFLPLSAVLGNWLTWWMGDTFGVLTITPIVLILFAEPREVWRSRRWNVMLPLVFFLFLVVTSFVFIRAREQQKQQFEFRLEAEHIGQNLQSKLNTHSDAVKNIERLYASSNMVRREDFATFVSHTIQNRPEITALFWAPKISHTQRSAFEAEVRKEGYPSFRLTERNPQSRLIAAAERTDYYPVSYLAPFASDSPAFGFDLGSETIRRTTIEDARENGQVSVTDPLILVTSKTRQMSVLLLAPVYAHGKPLTNIQQRKDAFQGVAASVLKMGELIESLLTEDEHASILLKFYDLSYPGSKGIYFNRIDKTDPVYQFQISIDFGGRQFALLAQPSDIYWKNHVSWVTWITMVGGLLFTGLLGIYLLMSTAHTFNVESLVKRRTGELHDREKRLRAILSNAAEGILTTNDKGEIESANPSATNMLGYPPGALSGRNIFSLFPDSASQEFLRQYLGSKSSDGHDSNEPSSIVRHQVLAKKQNGREIPIELAVSKVELGTQTLFVAMLHDQTEERRAEKLKSEFVSAVSHELRTPLTSIRGVLGLLVGGVGGAIPEKSMLMLKMANDNAIRLTTLINDLLDFEKLEYGGMQFNFEPLSLLDLLEKSIQANQGFSQSFNVSMQFKARPEDDVTVLVDAQRFIQVLSNLLSNAIKFSREKGQVEIRVSKTDDWVRIEVQDYGIGISDEFKNSIFQKFSQEDAKPARKYAGTGLGLSLSKNMIEKMQGKIGFSSIEAEGSIFYVELPIHPSADT